MRNGRIVLVVLMLLLAGGVETPPAASATDYLLFTSELDGTRALVARMDGEGNISYHSEFQVGPESNNIAVSPDGRVVVYGSYAPPERRGILSVFFVGADGSIDPPLYIENPMPNNAQSGAWNPVVFHGSLPLFYAGFKPLTSYHYLLTERTIDPTGHALDGQYIWPFNLGYSGFISSLVYGRLLHPDFITVVETLKVDEDGSFGDQGTSSTLSSYILKDFALSPDGRWAAVTTLDDPQLHLVRIEEDGAATLMQEIGFPYEERANQSYLAFTPDGRNLLMLTWSLYLLRQYEVDEARGELVLRSRLDRTVAGWRIDTAGGLTITPDGRYAAFFSPNYDNLSHALINLVRIHKDGTLEYLHGKEVDVSMHIGDMAFVPFPEAGVEGWVMYE